MMTLDEAIAHAREVASRERELYKMCPEDCDGLSDCRELKNGKDKGCNKCAEEHEQLAGWLEELAERREADRWIPVTEKLPEDETRVLTCNAEGDMLVCCGSRSTEIEGRFIWYTNGWRYGEVIAWKPLPKAPESEDEV